MTWPLVVRPREGVPLRPGRAGRGDAPPRPRRRAHRDRRARFGSGRAAASTTWREGFAAASASAPAIVTALADNPVGRLIEDLMLQGGVEQAQLVLARLRRDRARGPQRAQLHRTWLRRARRRRLLRPRAHRRRRSCGRATSTGSGSSASRVSAGSTRAASSARSRRRRRRSRWRPSPRHAATAPSSPTT